MSASGLVLTVGHSTRSEEEFVRLLQAHGVQALVDIRTIPKSRRHPHFAGDALAASLPVQGITYEHAPALGGLRKPNPDSRNGAWRHPSFRAYADHMETPAFGAALDRLGAQAAERRIVIMCAEAKWWQCHRQLVSDALLVRGFDVRHIMTETHAPAHVLTPFARVEGGTLWYPALL